jgi:hypothetical protein
MFVHFRSLRKKLTNNRSRTYTWHDFMVKPTTSNIGRQPDTSTDTFITLDVQVSQR